MLWRKSDLLAIDGHSESVLGYHVDIFTPKMAIWKAGDRHRRDGVQFYKGGDGWDATLFLGLSDSGLQRRLTVFATAGDALPVTIVRTLEQTELESVTQAAIRENENLKWGSCHV